MKQGGDPPVRLGAVLAARVYDPESNRDRCSRCERILITGQARCICGACFEGTISG